MSFEGHNDEVETPIQTTEEMAVPTKRISRSLGSGDARLPVPSICSSKLWNMAFAPFGLHEIVLSPTQHTSPCFDQTVLTKLISGFQIARLAIEIDVRTIVHPPVLGKPDH